LKLGELDRTSGASETGIARPQGRARIETPRPALTCLSTTASPGLKAGRGLKHLEAKRPKIGY